MVDVTITTARPLSKKLLVEITKKLSERYSEGVEIKTLVDESVIGGIRLHMGAEEIDATVRAKLMNLQQQLSRQLV